MRNVERLASSKHPVQIKSDDDNENFQIKAGVISADGSRITVGTIRDRSGFIQGVPMEMVTISLITSNKIDLECYSWHELEDTLETTL